MIGRKLGLLGDIVGANVRQRALPYKVQLVATYHCNFRCEMCSIWQKKSVNEMTPAEIDRFFQQWPHFSWVNLTGGELFMRRDLEEVVAAIQRSCTSLFLLNFPTTGWFGDRTVALVKAILDRGVGRLMVTISIDGPKALHEEMRGLPSSWDRGLETFRRLREIKRPNFQVVAGMTLLPKNATRVNETVSAIRTVIPDFRRTDLHLNIGHESDHYFGNGGYVQPTHHAEIVQAIEEHRRETSSFLHPVTFLENRYQGLVGKYYETHKSPLPCQAISSTCFIDAYWNLFPCSIWDAKIGNLREADFDLGGLMASERAQGLRRDVVEERCPHCWTPCEAYPTILGNLVKATVAPMALSPVKSEV